jgi:phosphatidylinositol alpha-1,6-mannosyltransferase
VQEGRTGHVVDGRDVAALAAAVGGLLAEPARARALGAAGRAWMLRDWSWPGLVGRLRGLLAGDQAVCVTPL